MIHSFLLLRFWEKNLYFKDEPIATVIFAEVIFKIEWLEHWHFLGLSEDADKDAKIDLSKDDKEVIEYHAAEKKAGIDAA